LKIKYLKIVRSQKKFFIGPQTGTFIGHRIARASPVHCSRIARASLMHCPRIARASNAHRPRIACATPAHRRACVSPAQFIDYISINHPPAHGPRNLSQ
jgi:hypothetical protein